ncbi:MAG: ABC transporter permease subunit [Chloroflexi bacterium]|nr:ABC transporter permease subunit [Chloroflexota bacterium]
MAAPDSAIPNPGPAAAPDSAIPNSGPAAAPDLVRPTLVARLAGLGTIFGKGIRDARRSILIIGVLMAVLIIVTASEIAVEYDSVAERLILAAQMSALPEIFQGMLGKPIAIDTLGGFLSWRTFGFLPVMIGIWSVVVLSGTLAGELSRGSLDAIAAGPISRRRLALEKLGSHLVALAAVVLILAAATYASIVAFGNLPGDQIGLGAVLGQHVWVYVAALAPAAVAFAVAPILGRGTALGIGSVVLFGSFLVNGYADSVPAFEAVRGLSYFGLTAGHRPLAGVSDWGSIAVLGGLIIVALAIGVTLFDRRDLVVPTGGRQRIPPLRLGVAGPFTRSYFERLPAAIAWGLGLALYGLVLATSADEFVAQLSKIPQVLEMIARLFPNADILSVGGFLQLAFFSEAVILVALAAAAFVAGWASDEEDRRLEIIMGTPVSRIGWALKSGIGVFAAIATLILFADLGVIVGAAIQGENGLDIAIGVSVLGAYGMAMAGVGLAVGGLTRPSIAAPVTVGLALGFYLLDLLGSILRLPDAILDLSLNRHLGKPILGDFDIGGLVITGILAIGGLAISAAGMQRRDLGR